MKLKSIIIILLLSAVFIFYKQYDYYHLLEEDLIIKINNEIIEYKNFDSKELSVLNSEAFFVRNLSNGNIIFNNSLLHKNETKKFTIDSLSKNKNITIKTKNKKFYIKLLPDDFPKLKKDGESSSKDGFLLSYNGPDSHYLIKTDYKGNVKAYKKIDELVYNFRRVDENRYMYTTQIKNTAGGNNDSIYELVVVDKNFNEIDKIQYILNNNTKIGLDVHDYVYIKDGHYIISSFQKKTVNNFPEKIYGKKNMVVQDTLIEEINNGQVIWEFKSSDYPNYYEYYNPNGVYGEKPTEDYYTNYMHFNSFAIDPNDNNLIVSFRNINSIIKINRDNGRVMWVLGGIGDEFHLKEEQLFLCQHSVSFKDKNTILLYDNGSQERNARIVEITIDQKNKRILDYKKYDLEFTTKNWGLVKHLENDTYLINYGQIDNNDIYLTEEKNYKNYKVNFRIDTEDGSIYHVYKDRYDV